MTILATYSPDFGFIDMITDEVFPYDISYDSVGSTRFATDVIVVDSGADQRIQRWIQPLMEYDVAYGVRTMEQLQALIAFFRAMRGRAERLQLSRPCRLHVERRRRSTRRAARRRSRRSTSKSISRTGSTTQFQLTKTYYSPALTQSQVRPIYRPVPGTVLIGVNGQEVTNFTVNDQGIVDVLLAADGRHLAYARARGGQRRQRLHHHRRGWRLHRVSPLRQPGLSDRCLRASPTPSTTSPRPPARSSSTWPPTVRPSRSTTRTARRHDAGNVVRAVHVHRQSRSAERRVHHGGLPVLRPRAASTPTRCRSPAGLRHRRRRTASS